MTLRPALWLIPTLVAPLLTACVTVEPPPPVKLNNRVYVANESGNSVSIIDAVILDTGTHRVIGRVPGGIKPVGVVASL